jgi:hypothetical protein
MMEGIMDHSSGAKAPVHPWIVGILALLWNGFGAWDYYMTRTKGAAWINAMMDGVDGDKFMAYINAFPLWASIGWGLGVWGALAGSILLLIRNKLAVLAFALSLIGAILGIGYQLLNPVEIPEMTRGFNGMVPYAVILIAIALYLYARSLQAKGLLR